MHLSICRELSWALEKHQRDKTLLGKDGQRGLEAAGSGCTCKQIRHHNNSFQCVERHHHALCSPPDCKSWLPEHQSP